MHLFIIAYVKVVFAYISPIGYLYTSMAIEMVKTVDIIRTDGAHTTHLQDHVAVEEPLAIVLQYMDQGQYTSKTNAITMRTPGDDAHLAIGFLFTENILQHIGDITHCKATKEGEICITLAPHLIPNISLLDRNFYTTSSCGICGKTSIEAIQTICSVEEHYPYDPLSISTHVLTSLADSLRNAQTTFNNTGGIHATGIFDKNGTLLLLKEDIGRHNALDKAIGALLSQKKTLEDTILFLSGRASFELVQKAIMAKIKVIVAIGAPSSLAVALAEDFNITLVGFMRGDRFNIYSGAQRITT